MSNDYLKLAGGLLDYMILCRFETAHLILMSWGLDVMGGKRSLFDLVEGMVAERQILPSTFS